jgi:hypothetical protein
MKLSGQPPEGLKTFALSLGIYALLLAVACLVVFPSPYSETPLLVVLVVSSSLVFIGSLVRGQRREAQEGTPRRVARGLLAVLLCLVPFYVSAGLFWALVYPIGKDTQLGIPDMAVLLLSCFTLGFSRRRVSIFSGFVIFSLIWGAGSVITWWWAGFLDSEALPLGALPAIFAAAIIRTISLSGISEDEKRPFWRSLFPLRAGWARKGSTFGVGCLVLLSWALAVILIEESQVALDNQREEIAALERKLHKAKVTASRKEQFETWKNEINQLFKEAEFLLGLTKQHEDWKAAVSEAARARSFLIGGAVVTDERTGWVLKDPFQYRRVRHRIGIEGNRGAIWGFLQDHTEGPGLGWIAAFEMQDMGNGIARASIDWDGYLVQEKVAEKKR